jgi:hypothetical protein
MMPPAEIVTVPQAGTMPAATTVVEVAAMEITAPAKVSVARPIPATPSWPAASSVNCHRRPRSVPAATGSTTTVATATRRSATTVATATTVAVLCQGRRCYQRGR